MPDTHCPIELQSCLTDAIDWPAAPEAGRKAILVDQQCLAGLMSRNIVHLSRKPRGPEVMMGPYERWVCVPWDLPPGTFSHILAGSLVIVVTLDSPLIYTIFNCNSAFVASVLSNLKHWFS